MRTENSNSFSIGIIKKLKPAMGFLLSVVFLNLVMNINYPAVAFDTHNLLKISPEVLILLSLISTAALLGVRFSRLYYLPLTAFVIFLRLFLIGEALIPMYFFRPFNLFLDSQFLPDLIHLLYTTFTFKEFLVFAVFAVALLIGITTGVWISFKTIHSYLTEIQNRRIVAGLAIAALMSIYVLQSGHDHHHKTLFARSFFHRVIEEGDFILHVKGYRERFNKAIDATVKNIERMPSTMDKLERANVFLFFVESYGHTMYADTHHFGKILPTLTRLEKDLFKGGYGVCSTFLNSPAFGGVVLAGACHAGQRRESQ